MLHSRRPTQCCAEGYRVQQLCAGAGDVGGPAPCCQGHPCAAAWEQLMLCRDITPWCWVVTDQGAQMQTGVPWRGKPGLGMAPDTAVPSQLVVMRWPHPRSPVWEGSASSQVAPNRTRGSSVGGTRVAGPRAHGSMSLGRAALWWGEVGGRSWHTWP